MGGRLTQHDEPCPERKFPAKQGKVSPAGFLQVSAPKTCQVSGKKCQIPKEWAKFPTKNTKFPPKGSSFLFQNASGFPKKLLETFAQGKPQALCFFCGGGELKFFLSNGNPRPTRVAATAQRPRNPPCPERKFPATFLGNLTRFQKGNLTLLGEIRQFLPET